jgi:excisionase family DNA binding protein
MLTVPQAARRVGKDAETVRRWIRSGKLRARRVGTQHIIDEDDLRAILLKKGAQLGLPAEWRHTWTGEPMPNAVRLIERTRRGR